MSAPKPYSPHVERIISTLPSPIADALHERQPFVIRPDGKVEPIPLFVGNTKPTLQQYQAAVGGDVQILRCVIPDWNILVNEDARILAVPPPANPHATFLYADKMFVPHLLLGSVVLTPKL